MAREQQKFLTSGQDRFTVVVSQKTGEQIRELAHQKRLSISKLIADAVRKYLVELERQDNSNIDKR